MASSALTQVTAHGGTLIQPSKNRPFARSDMVRNRTCRDARCTVGLLNHRNSNQSTLTCFCFESPTVQLASQHVWSCTTWLNRAKGPIAQESNACLCCSYTFWWFASTVDWVTLTTVATISQHSFRKRWHNAKVLFIYTDYSLWLRRSISPLRMWYAAASKV